MNDLRILKRFTNCSRSGLEWAASTEIAVPQSCSWHAGDILSESAQLFSQCGCFFAQMNEVQLNPRRSRREWGRWCRDPHTLDKKLSSRNPKI